MPDAGGKDSTVLAHMLTLLNERHGYGLDLFLLSIDEGITGYRCAAAAAFVLLPEFDFYTAAAAAFPSLSLEQLVVDDQPPAMQDGLSAITLLSGPVHACMWHMQGRLARDSEAE